MRGRIAAETPLRLPQECKNRGRRFLNLRAQKESIHDWFGCKVIVTECVERQRARKIARCAYRCPAEQDRKAVLLKALHPSSARKQHLAISREVRRRSARGYPQAAFSFDRIKRYAQQSRNPLGAETSKELKIEFCDGASAPYDC